MRWRRAVRWLAAVCAAGVIVLLATAWWVGGALVAPRNRPVGPPPADLRVESATLPSKSGSSIAAWYVPAEDAHATVVLLHGLGCTRRSMLDRARLLHGAGYALMMIDLQAHGESPGQHVTVGYLERFDTQAAVAFARKKNPGHRVGLIGCSLGGAAAVLGSPLPVDAMVLESVYPTIDEAVDDRVRRRLGCLSRVVSRLLVWQIPLRLGIPVSALRPIDRIAAVGCPVLIAAGDADRHTPLAETQRLFAHAAEPKKLVVFQGAAHQDLLSFDQETYAQTVLPFLERYLKR
jgi:uncharacterized protein